MNNLGKCSRIINFSNEKKKMDSMPRRFYIYECCDGVVDEDSLNGYPKVEKWNKGRKKKEKGTMGEKRKKIVK